MLAFDDLPLNRDLFSRSDKVLTITGATWSDYEKFDSEEYPGYRVAYFQGEIIVVSPGLNHEIIVSVIDRLILAYCDEYRLLEFPWRQTRLEQTGQAGREPDIAYSFQSRKSQPGLVVEVIFSSGDIDKLKESYQNIGISELWIWQKNEICFFYLDSDRYREIKTSRILPNIRAAGFVRFINRGIKESPSIIKQDFLKIIRA